MRRKGWKGAVCVVLAILLCGCSSGVKIVPIESLSPTSTAANVYVPKESPAAEETQVQTAPVVARIEDSGMTIGTRINPPMGYTRVRAADGSLGAFLRTYPVKSAGSPVMLYDGTERTFWVDKFNLPDHPRWSDEWISPSGEGANVFQINYLYISPNGDYNNDRVVCDQGDYVLTIMADSTSDLWYYRACELYITVK